MQAHDPVTPPRAPQVKFALAGHEPLPIVIAFYRRLPNLPIGRWAEVAEPDDAPAAIEARAQLRAIMDTRPRVVVRHRRNAQQVVAVAEGFVHRLVAVRMKKVALTASLALAARPELPPESFALLYAPFSELIPIEELLADLQPPEPVRADAPAHDDDPDGAMC